jgi:sulfate transport system ATP-binding protein
VLRGRVSNGRATVGPLHAEVPTPHGAADGAAVHAFVRPHEVRLTKFVETPQTGNPVALARVDRLAFIGAYVKVTLRLPDEGTLTVELGKAEFEALHIQTGDRVMTDLQEAKIFLGDYAI